MSAYSTPNPNGGIDVHVICDTCGQPIVKSNKYGMFCANDCGLAKSKKAYRLFNVFFKILEKLGV